MTETIKLWAAVDSITEPTKRRTQRGTQEVDLAGDLLHDLANNPTRLACSILEKQRADRLASEQTLAWGHIPPLWDQAMWAVAQGMERGEGGGRAPLRERTPADLALMETLADIREVVAAQLEGRGAPIGGTVPQQMRRLASTLGTLGNQEHIDWWTWRFAQWSRLLSNYLNALDHQPTNVYLRSTPCPLCHTRQITVEIDGEPRVVPAIFIDFADGWIRAATCGACGHAWFRGESLHELADLIDGHQASA